MTEENLPVWHVIMDAEDLSETEFRFIGTKEHLVEDLEWTCKGFVQGKEEDVIYSCLEKEHEIIAFASCTDEHGKLHSMNLDAVEVTALPKLFVTTKEDYELDQAEDRMWENAEKEGRLFEPGGLMDGEKPKR